MRCDCAQTREEKKERRLAMLEGKKPQCKQDSHPSYPSHFLAPTEVIMLEGYKDELELSFLFSLYPEDLMCASLGLPGMFQLLLLLILS